MFFSCIDQLGRRLEIPFPPTRIVSLVPSQTELLHYLGLEKQVVGITKFCVHPPDWYRKKPRIGGTKTVNIGAVKKLQPDLIIANKEENVRDQIEELEKIAPAWISDISTFEDAISMIKMIGAVADRILEAETLANEIGIAFKELRVVEKRRAAYLIWTDPLMAAGGNTFINDMMRRGGFENIFAGRERYPVIEFEEMLAAGCELLLLSSEPYPFRDKHIEMFRPFLGGAAIALVDGEIFSWYGSRLLQVPGYLKKLRQQLGLNDLR